MLLLASFILKGPLQAALVVAAMAVLGLLLPPVTWLSAAAIALVTLVNGYKQGLLVSAIAYVGAVLFSIIILSNMSDVPDYSPAVAMEMVLYFVLLVWLPAWLFSAVLQQTVSLAIVVQLLSGMSLLAVAVFYLLYPDFGELWRGQFDQFIAQLVLSLNELGNGDGETIANLQQLEDGLIHLLPGLFVSSLMLGTLISLLIGRWWQAVYFNPGGFETEFQSLSLGKYSALAALAIIVLALLQSSYMMYSFLMIVLMIYYVQGTSILHAVFKRRKLHTAWLIVVYGLLMFLPQVMLLLGFIGIADSWINIRQRVTSV